MKLVKEHINFERGLDPRDAMNTGNIIERLKQRYIKLLDELKDTKIRQEFFIDVTSKIPKNIHFKCGWGNVWKFFDEFNSEELNNFKKIISKYESKNG
jgi:hypothetical protein